MKVITIVEDTLPDAWEKAVIQCWEQGEEFPTEYDKAGDPNSRDVFATIHVKNPMAEPRLHMAMPGGFDDLEKYRAEMLYGVHDHWIDPDNGKWEYTYHERMANYKAPKEVESDESTWLVWQNINQIEAVIEKLKETPHTRRAQAVTWQVWNDTNIDDPTCLQRLWFRIQNGKLNMTAHLRSNDAFKAAFMNMYAFTELQDYVAGRLGVEVGEYIHVADSFHIYGSYFDDFEKFLEMIRNRPDRTFRTEDATAFFMDGCNALLKEKDMPEKAAHAIRNRLLVLNGCGR